MTIDSTSTIHDRLPSGFAYADDRQKAAYDETGIVPGARKVALVRGVGETLLAVRLGPPIGGKTLRRRDYMLRDARKAGVNPDRENCLLSWYVEQYNVGFAAGRRRVKTGTIPVAWDSGTSSAAYDDGYLDAVADRPKWHLAHCVDHDTCGEG